MVGGVSGGPVKDVPDDLKRKDALDDDAQFFTEELGKMPAIVHRLLAFWHIGVAVLAMWLLYQIWPVPKSAMKAPVDSLPTQRQVSVPDTAAGMAAVADTLTWRWPWKRRGLVPFDLVLFTIALCTGAVGGAAHGLSSLMDFRGQRRLFRSWSLWYLALPVLGGLMAFIFVLVLCAGLFPQAGATGAINPYGVAALGALVGLFTDKATRKLSEVLDELFHTRTEREGKLIPDETKKVSE